MTKIIPFHTSLAQQKQRIIINPQLCICKEVCKVDNLTTV